MSRSRSWKSDIWEIQLHLTTPTLPFVYLGKSTTENLTLIWRKLFWVNIFSLGLTNPSCCKAQTKRDLICGYSITSHYIQYMLTVPFQHIWLRAAVWLCEPIVTPFTFSMWAKLCISFALQGICIALWYVQLRLIVSFCPPLAALWAEWMKWMERKGGEPVQKFISVIILCENWKQRWADVSDLCANQSLLLSSLLSFHYETSLSHFPVESSPQCGEPVSSHSMLPELQPSQYCI